MCLEPIDLAIERGLLNAITVHCFRMHSRVEKEQAWGCYDWGRLKQVTNNKLEINVG